MSAWQKIMNIHLKYWRFGGIWPLPSDGILYRVYMLVLQLFASVIFNGCVLASLWNHHTFEDFLKCLMPAITTVLTSVKIAILLRNQSKMFGMFADMQQLDDQFATTTNKLHHQIDDEIVAEALRRSRQLLLFISVTSYTAITLAFLMAILSPEKLFMWPTALPYDVEHDDRLYYGSLVLQYALNLYVGIMFTSLDIYGPVLLIVLTVYMDRLGLRLKRIGRDAATTAAGKKGDADELNKCVAYHIQCFQLV